MNSANIEEKILNWLMDQKFYHGYLPREDLPYLLRKKGDYIVRLSERITSKIKRKDIVLSIAWPTEPVPIITTKDIKNILIERNANGFWLDTTMSFKTIEELFSHYRSNDIINQNKEKIKLQRAVGLLSWEYKHSQIVCLKKVGQGAYGEVFKGKAKRGNKTFDVAIKAMRKDLDAGDEKMKEVMAEARLMRSLNHPNIVRCRGIAVLEQPLYIVIDFITGGGLDVFLRKSVNTMSIQERNKMAISAAWGIEFMHSHDIIHRDIAARNCLYDKKNLVKLSDFGLSRKGSYYKMKKAMKMPTRWLAPESLSTYCFSRASDVYTYGVLLYEIYTCQEPFLGVNGADARKKILSGCFPDFEKKAPKEMYDIVKSKIYQLDPAKRGTMNEIVKTLEQWLEVELVLDVDDRADVDPESNRAGQTKTDETTSSQQKTAPTPPPTTTPPKNSQNKSASRSKADATQKRAQKNQTIIKDVTITCDSTPEMASNCGLHKLVDDDKREMDELKPPEEDIKPMVSPNNDPDSILENRQQAEEKDKS